MDISAAAMPPIQPFITASDRAHHRFPEYMTYRHGMNRLLVQADSFANWLHQVEQSDKLEAWASHPRFSEFQQWMWANKGGDPKRSPAAFPENFKRWLNGTRW